MNMNDEGAWVFRLFVSEKSPRVDRSVATLEQICRESLGGKCDIQVIDLVENPSAAVAENIMATPTLLKKLPPPARRIIGDLSDKENVLVALEIIDGRG